MTSMVATAYTCASCHARFEDAPMQRAHYRSDWHRYNLRRKVSDLPPVSESVFQMRADSAVKAKHQEMVDASSNISFECKPCRKSFATENAYNNHLESRKHHAAIASKTSKDSTLITDEKSQTEKPHRNTSNSDLLDSLSEDATEEQIRLAFEARLAVTRRLRSEECLFCSTASADADSNLIHMKQIHGLYIPDEDYLVDRAGLLGYLADKLAVAHLCLACPMSKQPFGSLEAVRRHMIDAGHAKIRFDEEGITELADFYDYSLFDDDIEEEDDSMYSDIEDEEMVDSDDSYNNDQVDDGCIYIAPDESHILLPSGSRLVHRKFMFQRRLLRAIQTYGDPKRMPVSTSTHLLMAPKPHDQKHQEAGVALLPRQSDQRLAMGIIGSAEAKSHGMAQRIAMERRAAKRMSVSVKANRLQRHFRDQLLQ